MACKRFGIYEVKEVHLIFPKTKVAFKSGAELCNVLKTQVTDMGKIFTEKYYSNNSNRLDLGRRAMLHHTDSKFLDVKMSHITITCKLLVISSLVQIENILKINNLQNIKI